MYKKISKYMIYNELKIYINDLTLSRATKADSELCIYIDTLNLIGFYVILLWREIIESCSNKDIILL